MADSDKVALDNLIIQQSDSLNNQNNGVPLRSSGSRVPLTRAKRTGEAIFYSAALHKRMPLHPLTQTKSSFFVKFKTTKRLFASVKLNLLPVKLEFVTVKWELLPVKWELLPVKLEFVPVKWEFFPDKLELLPVKLELLPVKLEFASVKLELIPAKLYLSSTKMNPTV